MNPEVSAVGGARADAQSPHTEIFFVDGLPRRWGFQCFNCGFELLDLAGPYTAQANADSHRCEVKP